MALISLGNILHHARLSEEAAIVTHAAVDLAPDNAICHFTLGNIYAVSTVVNFHLLNDPFAKSHTILILILSTLMLTYLK